MCDTLCSLAANNSDGRITYFGKNSDRDPNEMQLVEYYPPTYRTGKFKATYIEVEAEGPVNGVLISRPYWMWGAEMGVNDHGVAIGNEALFTPRKEKQGRLLGMDLLRLGLEKGTSAAGAVDTIIGFLETYGQGGDNSAGKGEYYDNSFLVVDWKDAYVLETVGIEWNKKKVSDFYSISNCFSDQKLGEHSDGFRIETDFLYTRFGHGRQRRQTTFDAIKRLRGRANLLDIIDLMRTHDWAKSHPRFGSNKDVCMHAGPFSRRFQTVNSMVAEIAGRSAIVWFTYSSNPCISLFKPVFMGGSVWGAVDYSSEYWLTVERLHRRLVYASEEQYGGVMVEAREFQGKVLAATEHVRQSFLNDGPLGGDELWGVCRSIRDIDREYIEKISGVAARIPDKVPYNYYYRWWGKTNKELSRLLSP
jgi:hypothetical protein